MSGFWKKAWPSVKVDLLALAQLAFVAAISAGCHLAFGWDAYGLLIGWIGFIAAKSHVRLTMMDAP